MVCQCTVLLEHKVVTIHSAYLWQQFLSQKHTTIVYTVYFVPGSTKNKTVQSILVTLANRDRDRLTEIVSCSQQVAWQQSR